MTEPATYTNMDNLSMYNRIKAYIIENEMIKPGDHIVIGLSGGPDSVCLFFALLNLKSEIPFTMKAVHVNHRLFQKADTDAIFVEDLCLRNSVEFRLFEKDIKKAAKEQGLSIEEAGRDYRYQCFKKILNENGSGKIAVAHHQNDRAETILFNLFRGSGLRGLTGIRPIRDNIIRPLLCLNRQEIEDYLNDENIPYLTDYTNAEDLYTRNRIRNHIIPFAKEVNPEAIRHMAKTAELVWEAESYLHKHTETAFDECVKQTSGKIIIDLIILNKQDIIIKKRILIMAVEKLLPGRQNISTRHIDSLVALTITGGSQEISLPHSLIASKEYDTLVINLKDKTVIEFKNQKMTAGHFYGLALNEHEITIPKLGIISCRTFLYQKNENIPQKTYTKWFDCDKITSCAIFRRRQSGDFLIINKHGQRKKLKDYLINEKIPKAKRDDIYILADGPHIIWVPSLRISEHYKVTNETKTILEVTITLN